MAEFHPASVRVARITFRAAAIYGLIVLLPLSIPAVAILLAQGRLEPFALSLPAADLVIGLAFAWVWLRLRREVGKEESGRG